MMVVRSATVSPPTLSAAVLAGVTAAVRTFDDDDDEAYTAQLAASVARGIEIHCDRIVWPALRTSTAVVYQDARCEVDHFPTRPRTAGGAVSTLQLWHAGAYRDADYAAVTPSSIQVDKSGIYRIVSTVTITDDQVEPHMIEAAARLFAFQWQLRPGDIESSGMQQSIAGAMIKSGAIEILGAEETFTM